MQKLDILTNPNQRARKNTLMGGVLSIILTLVIILVLSGEYSSFKGLKVTKNLYLDPHPIEETLRIKLDIVLKHAPCAILSLDMMDDLNHEKIDKEIPKKKIDSNGNFLEDVS